MTVKIEEKKLMYSMPRERKPIIMNKLDQTLTEIEKEGEICGFIFFGFMSSSEGVKTWCEYEGLVNPAHILEALESFKIINKVTI